MSFQPSSLLELAARVITVHKVKFDKSDLPLTLSHYLECSHHCVNPKCGGVYFDTKVRNLSVNMYQVNYNFYKLTSFKSLGFTCNSKLSLVTV